jgi:hypothetical protein
MLRASFMLAAIPALVFAIAGPVPPQPIKPHAVQVENIREQRADDQTFRRRWSPLYDQPPAIEVRYSRPVNVSRETAREPTDTVARSAPQPRPRHRLNTKPARFDICARHNLRKVITNRGRSWRCRR